MTEIVDIAARPDRQQASDLEWGNGAITVRIAWGVDQAPFIADVMTAQVALSMPPGLPLVDVVTVGSGHTPASGRLVHSTLGEALRYRHHEMHVVDGVHHLLVELVDQENTAEVILHLSAHAGVAAVRARAEVRNLSGYRALVLRSVTSFSSYLGSHTGSDTITEWQLHHAKSEWLGEGRWTHTRLADVLPELHEELTGHNPRGFLNVASTGTWSTGEFLPTGALESPAATWAWQIEHNGAWRWDTGQDTGDHWLALSGPTDDDHQWARALRPGETFQTVPATVALAADLPAAVAVLTQHRRAARRPHPDNTAMPVVFNDYMNTLNGDPTTEQLEPLIDAAAAAGAEIFCIDAGWYADGYWWNSVGEWRASEARFPEGLGAVVARIRQRGMIAGLWLEPEVIGVESPAAQTLPEAAFISRFGQRVVEHDRYHLDLRHPAAIAHLDATVDRLIAEYGVGFFKFDYNINAGPGTDRDADSVGEGLLQHNRAHLAWLDSLLVRHPSLVIENCSSGAMRADFAMLSRLHMQSTSDQQHFLSFPAVAAAAPMQMLPEQAANWAYPQPEMTLEEAALCLVTGLLGRFYVSGYLNRMEPEQQELVAEAVTLAKQLRAEIQTAYPFWPLGLPKWDDAAIALGLSTSGSHLVSVWDRTEPAAHIELQLPDLVGHRLQVQQIFPLSLPSWSTQWDPEGGVLHVHTPAGSVGARVLRIESSHRDD